MKKDGMEAVHFDDGYEPILPDGWKEGEDLFAGADDEFGGPRTDETGAEPTSTEENEGNVKETDPAPTTDEGSEDSATAEDDTEGQTPDGENTPAEKSSRILKLKVNHKDKEIDVNSLTDEELIEKLQKAEAFDAMKDDQQKEKYRKVYNDEILAGMTDAAAKMVAAHSVGGKEYSLEDEEESPAPETEPTPTKSPAGDDFKAQLKQLQTLDPEVRDVPQEVLDAYMAGGNLVAAYAMYKLGQSKKAAAKVEKENQVLRQNAASAARSPVKGVANSGAGKKEKTDDPFLKGLLAEDW